MTPRSTGIYGLFRLDGGPIDPLDARALGVPEPQSATASAVLVVDEIEPGAVHQSRDAGDTAILLGHIDEPDTLAARLGLNRDTPPLQLALAAHDRFGNDLPREMMGGWTLLRWHAEQHRVVAVQSINGRNPVLFARCGPVLAIAPAMQYLLRLSWVSADLHAPDLAHSLSSNLLRDARDSRTFVRAVQHLGRSRTLHSDARGETIHAADPHLPVTRWRGSFDEAMATAAQLLRSNVRGVMARAAPGRVGAFNSGGLDSSTLSWLAASEKPAGAQVPLLASAVDADRGMPDEVPFSQIVADHLGEPLYPVIPPRAANPYRPRIADFLAAHAPQQSPRHYLYDSFKDQALALGITHILDGAMGELTFTSPFELPNWLRRMHIRLRPLRMRLTHPDLRPRWPDDAVMAWLAPGLIAQLSPALRDNWQARPPDNLIRRRGEAWGYPAHLATLMNRTPPEFSPGRIRLNMPFLDIRLLQLFAGFPTDYMVHGGLDRSPARHALRGQLPDSISLRPKGLAFSPDYHQRLSEHAANAAARIPLFRKAGLGEWFDLDRLEHGLGQVGCYGRAQLNSAFKIQLTASNCEFFLWWIKGRKAAADDDQAAALIAPSASNSFNIRSIAAAH